MKKTFNCIAAGIAFLVLTNPGKAEDEGFLDEIILTATRTERSVRDLGGRASVITADKYSGSSHGIESMLSNEEGLDIRGGTFPGSESSIFMRGVQGRFQTQRILVMVDGRPINEEYQGAADLRALPLAGVERVEVVRGPGSSLYGTDAMAGVVNIIRKFGEPGTIIDFGVGSDSTWTQSITNGNTFDGFRYQVTGSRVATQGYMQNTNGTDKDWDMGDSNVKLGWRVGDQSEIALSTGYQESTGTRESFQDSQIRDYQDVLFTAGTLQVRAYRNGYARELDWNFGFDAEYTQHTEAGNITKTFDLGTHRLTVGAECQQETADVKEAAGNVKDTLSSMAIFVQDEVSIGENVELTFGTRYDKNFDFDSELSPRIGLVYKVRDNTDLYVSVAKAFRAPSISDLQLPLTFFWGRFYQGSENINPETMWAYEIGARHIFGNKASAEIAVFHNDLHDAWDFMVEGDGVFRPRNATRTSIWGTEIDIDLKLTDRFSAHTQFSFAESLYEQYDPDPSIEGNVMEDTPRVTGSFSLEYNTPSGVSASAILKHTGVRYTDPQNSAVGKLDEYSVVDLRLSSPLWRGCSGFITVSNAFNEDYSHFETWKEPDRKIFTGISCKF